MKLTKVGRFVFILLTFVSCQSKFFAQNVLETDLQTCYQKAINNFPLVKQNELIDNAAQYNVENANKNYLPQFSINGQATYQSEVTKIDISIPGFPKIEALSKDQYKIFGEISQLIYDGGAVSAQKSIALASQTADKMKNQTDLYKLKQQVQQMYFGILLLKAQNLQTAASKRDIEAQRDKINAAVENGTAYPANLDMIDAELLKLEQRTLETSSNIEAFVEMLAYFTGMNLSSQTNFSSPPAFAGIALNIIRPELSLFDAQKSLIDNQLNASLTNNLPKLSAFFQGGYGKPTLNVLKNEFGTYYLGGLRLQWNLTSLYTRSNFMRLADVNKSIVQNQKDAFIFNTNMQATQQSQDIDKYKKLIEIDEKLIKLLTNIKNVSATQLENGVITTSDFIKNVSAEDQSRQAKSLHEIQLLSAQHLLQFTTGNE